MKPAPISIQLYTVRELAAKDPVGTITQIAAAGYVGVEPAGLYGMTPKEFRALLDQVGLVASSIHGALPTVENLEEIVETARTIGYKYHISGFGPPEFATVETIVEAAAQAQKAATLLKPYGIKYGYHNHWWEWEHKIAGMYPHELLMAYAPDLFAEVDTYWAKVGGACPVMQVAKLGCRAPLLHIKDGPAVKDKAMTAVGKGTLDWQRVVAAASNHLQWMIVELDSCDTDMMQAVVDSYAYLIGNGMATGRK
jgi:sugar phosphate isomerase/epimerase